MYFIFMKEYQKAKKNLYLFVSFFLGIIAFLCIYGFEPLRYTGLGWTQHGFDGNDITQHQTGWMFFRNSPWTFPLCKTLHLGYPEGVSIAFTDSIPIAAVFFKIISPALPRDFQYFGIYTCFCFAMQGLFAAALLYRFTENKLYSVIGSVLFITASCFLERCFRHTALSSHWMLLAALWLYFAKTSKSYLKWSIILCIAIGVHPYLYVMVLAVYFIFSAENIYRSQIKKLDLIYSLISAATSFIFGYVLGIFGTNIDPATGFGVYSLNLNAIFNPNSAHHKKWSAWMQNRPLYAGQSDGIYYLGLPMLLLTAAAVLLVICFRAKAVKAFIKKHPLYISLCTLFTIYAFSNIIAFDDHVIFRYALSKKLIEEVLNIFRASARFFFIPYYSIILFTLTIIYKSIPVKRFAIILVSIITILQTVEIRPGLIDFHQYFSERIHQLELSHEWTELADTYSTAISFDCLADRTLAFWLAQHGFKTNMMISAPVHMDAYWKQTENSRNKFKEELYNGTFDLNSETIYIISEQTGKNCVFNNEEQLVAYLDVVRSRYKDKANIFYLTDWYKNYWIICPVQ